MMAFLVNSNRCSRYGVLLRTALMVAGVSAVALYLLRPIYDADFFWHLKTGEWIWQHKSLPIIDPFTLDPPAMPAAPQKFILTSYWLSQIIVYAFYSAGGWAGIILLRFVLAGVVLLILSRSCDLRDSGVVALLTMLAIQFLEVYNLERPQVFSFICFALLMVLLVGFIEQQKGELRRPVPFITALSLVMLVWANMHGGYFVGQLVLVVVMIMEGGKFIHPALRPMSWSGYRYLLIGGCGALAMSLCNPNAMGGLRQMALVTATNAYMSALNEEYFSILKVWQTFGVQIVFLNILVIVLVLIMAWKSRKEHDVTMFTVLACTGYFGCLHIRFMPFFLVAAAPFIARRLGSGTVGFVVRGAIILATGWALLSFASDEIMNLRHVERGDWVSTTEFPVKAADFLAEHHAEGGVYSTFLWGGYLVWRLAPEGRLFHDSRGMDLKRLWEWQNSQVVGSSGVPYWKSLFGRYGIRYAVIELYQPSGRLSPLAASMQQDREWEMLFSGDNTAVFAAKQQLSGP